MKTLKTVTLTIMAVLVLLAAGSALAQEKQRFGERVDPKAPKVTLAQLIAKPNAYAGKMVVVDGRMAGPVPTARIFTSRTSSTSLRRRRQPRKSCS